MTRYVAPYGTLHGLTSDMDQGLVNGAVNLFSRVTELVLPQSVICRPLVCRWSCFCRGAALRHGKGRRSFGDSSSSHLEQGARFANWRDTWLYIFSLFVLGPGWTSKQKPNSGMELPWMPYLKKLVRNDWVCFYLQRCSQNWCSLAVSPHGPPHEPSLCMNAYHLLDIE